MSFETLFQRELLSFGTLFQREFVVCYLRHCFHVQAQLLSICQQFSFLSFPTAGMHRHPWPQKFSFSACMATHMGVHAHDTAHRWRPKDNFSGADAPLPSRLEAGPLMSAIVFITQASGHFFPVCFPFHLLSSILDIHHCIWPFMWVLGGQTRVITPTQQALYPQSHLSSFKERCKKTQEIKNENTMHQTPWTPGKQGPRYWKVRDDRSVI